ncbi:hypothetical protein BDZ91DRAFT_745985 [Kalaharituber pfeilii]|nr:hypothetical protein BDZ91DRAFT_745985 [Kalaharituber pfeilii]
MANPSNQYFALPYGPGSAAQYRARLQELLAQGVNVEGCKAGLAALAALPPEAFQPKTPQQLRVESLRSLLAASEVEPPYKVNIAACIAMYENGTMEFEYGRYYLVKDGQLVGGPRQLKDLDEAKLWFAPDRGNLWIEKCEGQKYLMPSYAFTIPADPNYGHHWVSR